MRLKTERLIKKWLKYGFFAALAFSIWKPEYIKRAVYPHIYGKKVQTTLKISDHDVFTPLADNEKITMQQYYEGEKIEFIPQEKYSITAKIGILERYGGWWESFYHGHDKNRMIYNKFAPIDLALFHGLEQNADFKKCVSHEYRLLWDKCKMKREYYNNYHIIPATKNIRRATETLIQGDVVQVEGILMNVKFPTYEMKTGTSHGMIHQDQFAGGLYTGMCFITYVKRLLVNGYVYE